MKFNNDCARKILMEIEKIEYGENLRISDLQKKMSEYSLDEILRMINLFNIEYYVNLVDKNPYDKIPTYEGNRISSLSEKGYRALDKIRNDDVWNLMKEKIDDFDNLSFFTIIEIASRINLVKYNRLFNLPDNVDSRY